MSDKPNDSTSRSEKFFFRVHPIVAANVRAAAAEHKITVSDFLRLSVYVTLTALEQVAAKKPPEKTKKTRQK
jgi:hypothetical protein